MTATRPTRLQLSRRGGFDLQALSKKFNGLDVVNVARPNRWCNPFTVTQNYEPGAKISGGGVFYAQYTAVPSVEDAVECFREMMSQHPEWVEEARRDLRGKNLACWCKNGHLCHADVLLEISNT